MRFPALVSPVPRVRRAETTAPARRRRCAALAASVVAAVAVGVLARPTAADTPKVLLPATSAAPAPAAAGAPAAPSGQVLQAPAPRPGNIALTFDDGPDPQFTPKVLAILDRYGIKATFFLVGEMVKAHPELVREIVRRGHSIADHSWSHPQLPKLSDAALQHEIVDTKNLIESTAGRRLSCMRPPFGAHNARTDEVSAANGLAVVMWTVDPTDWAKPGADAIRSRILGQAQPGGIVLMHDAGGDRSQTVAALPAVIEGLRARGLGFDALCGPPRVAFAPVPARF